MNPGTRTGGKTIRVAVPRTEEQLWEEAKSPDPVIAGFAIGVLLGRSRNKLLEDQRPCARMFDILESRFRNGLKLTVGMLKDFARTSNYERHRKWAHVREEALWQEIYSNRRPAKAA